VVWGARVGSSLVFSRTMTFVVERVSPTLVTYTAG
jgi:hypothetical protein